MLQITELGFYSVAAVYEAHMLRRQLACCSCSAPGPATPAHGFAPEPEPDSESMRKRKQSARERKPTAAEWERQVGLALRYVRASVVLPLAFVRALSLSHTFLEH